MRLIEDDDRTRGIDIERRRTDRPEVSSLLQSDLRASVAPGCEYMLRSQPTATAERMATQSDVHAVLELPRHMWRFGAAGRNDDALAELRRLEQRVVLEATGSRGERIGYAYCKLTAAFHRARAQSHSLERVASGSADEDRTADVAPVGSLDVIARAVDVVREVDLLASGCQEGRKMRRVENGSLFYSCLLGRGGGERGRRDTGNAAEYDSENRHQQAPDKRLPWPHVALLCSLVRQQ